MQRYYVSELYPHARYTAGVLREDIETILQKNGYRPLELPASTNWGNRLLKYAGLRKLINTQLSESASVFFHFPLRSRMNRKLVQLLKKNNVKTIAYIHDFEGLRDHDRSLLQEELEQLREFDVIIAQNSVMKELVQKEIQYEQVIDVEMYDYLHVKQSVSTTSASGSIVFAGNPEKAPFIHQLISLKGLNFNIYGTATTSAKTPGVVFKGKEDPRELPHIIAKEGSYGLVWDGSSLQSGKDSGSYLRINTPHKLALYIMAGLPVIVWKESAMATWVQQQQIGVAVPSLYELKNRLDVVTPAVYQQFCNNMNGLRQKMSEGYFLTTALQKAEGFLS